MGQYDAFISYSHAVDAELAAAIRHGLQQLARPWNKRRALNVFLDKAALEVSPGLKAALQQDLAGTEWLIVLLSERSAASPWVAEEIAHWASTKSPDRILLVHTDGELHWAGGDWDYQASTAAPRALSGVYAEEPLWLDLRRYRGEADLDIRSNAAFKDDLATLAAPLHGKSKEELVGEDLAQYRRARRLRRIAVSLLALLTVVATAAGVVAFLQRQDALAQARRAQSRATAAQALRLTAEQPDLAALLALESLRVADTAEARASLLAAVSTPTRFGARTNATGAAVTALAVSPDGRHAAAGHEDGVVVLWAYSATIPVEVGRARLGARVAHVQYVERNGGVVLEASGEDGAVGRWTLEGEELALQPGKGFEVATLGPGHLAGRTGDLLSVLDLGPDLRSTEMAARVAPGANHLTVAGARLAWAQGNEVLVWDWRAGGDPAGIEFDTWVTSVAADPAGSLLVVGELDGSLSLVDPATAEIVAALLIASAAPTALAVGTGGTPVVSGNDDGTVTVWDGTSDATLHGHNHAVWAAALGPGGRLVSGSRGGDAIWWLPGARGFETPYPAAGAQHEASVREVAFLDEGTIASLDVDGRVILTDLDDGAGREAFGGGVAAIAAAGGLVAVGGGSEVAVTSTAPGAEPKPLPYPLATPVLDVELSVDGSTLAAASFDIAIWDARAGELVGVLELPEGFSAFRVLFGRDAIWAGGMLADTGPAVVRIDPGTLAVTAGPVHVGGQPGDIPTALTESLDGAVLLVGGTDRLITGWKTDTLEPTGVPFAGRPGAITDMVFLEGGRWLVSTDGAQGLSYWDVARSRLVATFPGPGRGLQDLEISGDGELVAAAGLDGRVWTWPFGLETWLEAACELAGRNMDDLEWRLYGRGERVRHCPGLPGEGEPAAYPAGE